MKFSKKIEQVQGEVEKYIEKEQDKIIPEFYRACRKMKLGHFLNRNNIRKEQGHPLMQVLLVLLMIPFIRLKTINQFWCKNFEGILDAQKDTYYRLVNNASYNWQGLLHAMVLRAMQLTRNQERDNMFIIDDTVCSKRGKCMENVSYIFDHTVGRAVLGYNTVGLGLFTGTGFLPVGGAFKVGDKKPAARKKRKTKKNQDRRTLAFKNNNDAENKTKHELALQLVQAATAKGIRAAYVLFDSWYASQNLVCGLRALKMHVICRVKKDKRLYVYNGHQQTLTQLYNRYARRRMRAHKDIGLKLFPLVVEWPGVGRVTIVFSRFLNPPAGSDIPTNKWVAFLCTDGRLSDTTIIEKYVCRWSIEVFFKETKQLLSYGKCQSESFTAQINSMYFSMLRYVLLSTMKQLSSLWDTIGTLFESMADELCELSFSKRLIQWFLSVVKLVVSEFSKIFKADFSCILDMIDYSYDRTFSVPLGCET